MKIYDEATRELITNPDLENGYLYDGVIVVGHEEERIEVMDGTVTAERPDGLRRRIPAPRTSPSRASITTSTPRMSWRPSTRLTTRNRRTPPPRGKSWQQLILRG